MDSIAYYAYLPATMVELESPARLISRIEKDLSGAVGQLRGIRGDRCIGVYQGIHYIRQGAEAKEEVGAEAVKKQRKLERERAKITILQQQGIIKGDDLPAALISILVEDSATEEKVRAYYAPRNERINIYQIDRAPHFKDKDTSGDRSFYEALRTGRAAHERETWLTKLQSQKELYGLTLQEWAILQALVLTKEPRLLAKLEEIARSIVE